MTWLLDNEITQRSAEWHAWRSKHIGASDVPTIMGESDFGTALDLWLVKTGKKPPFAGNFATQRGIDAEPEIKALYESRINCSLESPVMEWPEWPILSASLDGYNKEHGILAEFKYPSKEKHVMAIRGEVPPTYRAQLQTQMLVTGLTSMDYVSYDGSHIAVVRVEADPHYQVRIVEKCREFWGYIERDEEPPSKYVVKEGEELQKLAYTYKNLLIEKRQIEEKLAVTREAICVAVPEQHASFYGLTIARTIRKGAVDYSKIPGMDAVDVEKYRKKSIEVVTINES